MQVSSEPYMRLLHNATTYMCKYALTLVIGAHTSKEWNADAHKSCDHHKQTPHKDSGEELVADTPLQTKGLCHIKHRHGIHLQQT